MRQPGLPFAQHLIDFPCKLPASPPCPVRGAFFEVDMAKKSTPKGKSKPPKGSSSVAGYGSSMAGKTKKR